MEALRQYLKSQKLSQTELAKLLGVSQPTVCDWINGNISPNGDRLRDISRITGISTDELLGVKPAKRRA